VLDDDGVVAELALLQSITAREGRLLSGSFLALDFGLAPSREARLLASEMRIGFQFVVLTGVTVEENDLLRWFVSGLRHGVLTSGTALAALAFWTRDAKAPASSDASAPSYGAPENVRVIAVIEAEGKLVQVERQVFTAHVMVCTDDATFEQTPERIDALGMNLAAYVLASRMGYCVVLVAHCPEVVVAGVIIGCDQVHFPANSLSDKAVKRSCIGMFDHLADDITFTGDRSDNRSLVTAESALAALLIPMAIFVFPAQVRFVHFDDAHKLTEIRIGHPSPEPMAHIEGCAVGAGTNHAMNLKGADPLLAGKHQVQHFEPDQQLVIRVLEDCPADDRESIAVLLTDAALPVPRFEVELVDGGVAAARTLNHAVRPAALHQVLLAGGFIWKESVKFRKRHLTDELWFMFLPCRVHEKRIAQI
jgi:hypothetical protein